VTVLIARYDEQNLVALRMDRIVTMGLTFFSVQVPAALFRRYDEH
jgi:hypothetical protein